MEFDINKAKTDETADEIKVMSRNCKNCEYYFSHKESEGNTGNCRRYPPQKLEAITVSSDYWCGEFQLKPELQRNRMKQLLIESGMKHDAEKYFGDC